MGETGSNDTNMDNTASERAWPFSRSELMAGLRRYLAASSLRLLDITPIELPSTMPGRSINASGTRLSGMSVNVSIDGEDQNLPLVLKEPPVSRSGRVLRAVGQREYGVYRRLAPHLPLLVPGLVAGDETDGWIVLEVLTGLRPAHEWTVEDYREAITNLAVMHDRFWGLSEDLATYPWLARPLDADYKDTTEAAAEAVQVLAHENRFPTRTLELLQRLTQSAAKIVAPLQAETATLIHGDYWPGNIARPIDGRQIVFDWQLASIGPAILDVVGFVQSTRMTLQPEMTYDAMTVLYREKLDELSSPGWSDEHFSFLWDHALMWLFIVNWLGRLATMPPELYARIEDAFNHVWLGRLFEAAEKRL
jgi:aminoglycoside/choline kinase family phosphotransferase